MEIQVITGTDIGIVDFFKAFAIQLTFSGKDDVQGREDFMGLFVQQN